MEPNWWLLERLGGVLPTDETGKLSASQIEGYFEQLGTLFSNEWHDTLQNEARKKLPPKEQLKYDFNPLSCITTVANPVGNLIRLGEMLMVLGGCSSLPTEVIGRLRDILKPDWQSVWYELEVSACFTQAGLAVTLYPLLPSGRQPDGVIRFRETDVYFDAHLAKEMFPPPERWDQTGDLPNMSRKAMRNLLDKYKQLPRATLGVLIMDSVRLLSGADLDAMITEAEAKLRPGQRTRIAGIILANKNAERSGFIRVLPRVIVRSPDAKPYLEEMEAALMRFPEWF